MVAFGDFVYVAFVMALGVGAVVLLMATAMFAFVRGGLAIIWLADTFWDRWDAFIAWSRTCPRWATVQYRVWIVGYALVASWFIVAVPTLAVTWYVYVDPTDVPDPQVILDWQPAQIGTLYDRDGAITMRAATEYRQTLTPEQFKDARYDAIRQALIAAEDKRFWDHQGYDRFATFRATLKTLFTSAKIVSFRQQGASTISQQVVRNVYLQQWHSRERSSELIVDNLATRLMAHFKGPVVTNRAIRKVREIKYAVRMEYALERRFGDRHAAKEHILAVYANLPYMGHGVYGMSYAAQFYFDKDLRDLNPAEAAFLASLIPAPDVFGRLTNTDVAEKKARRDAVLNREKDNGFITKRDLKMLAALPVTLNLTILNVKTEAPAVVDSAIKELQALGYTQEQLFHGDVQIHLASDLAIQRAVNVAAWRGINGDPATGIPGFKGRFKVEGPLPQIAVVVLDNGTGAILAEHGGIIAEDTRYNYATYNRAPNALRQPGSTFKVVDMVAGVAAGLQPESIVMDVPVSVNMGGGRFKSVGNYDGRSEGPISWFRAAAESRNQAFMNMMRSIGGIKPVLYWAPLLGIKSHLDPYISTVLGASSVTPLEMANVMRTVASGVRAEPFTISKITNRDGRDIYINKEQVTPFPMPPEKLDLVRTLTRGNVLLPTGTAHKLDTSEFPIQVMCKTGTSNEHRDAWIICSTYGTKGITIAVWVGYDQPSRTLPHEGPLYMRASGGAVALPIARDIFLQVYGEGKPLGNPPQIPPQIGERIRAYLERQQQESAK